MEFNLENIDAERILQELVHMGTNQVPVAGGLVTYVVDAVFFPTPEVDLWKQMEEKVSALVESRLDEAVTSIGNNAAASLLARLKALSSQLKLLTYVADPRERKQRLGALLALIDAAAAECVSLPAAHLLTVPDVLRPLSLAHVAALMDLKALEPHRYEHQAALNHVAIAYSDLAGSLFRRAIAWRMGVIAQGNGTLVESQRSVDEIARTQKVEIAIFDRFHQNRWHGGTHGHPIYLKTVEGLRTDRVDTRYAEAKEAAYAFLTGYAKQVETDFTALWDAKLLKYTQSFMKLVDWDGVNREKRGETGVERRRLTFPVHPSPHRSAAATALDRLDLFLEQQMDQFTVAGPRYVQTYHVPAAALAGEHALTHLRADTYDTSVACVYFQERGDLARAADLADALVVALNHDDRGGGRIVAATRADELLDRGMGNSTSVHPHDGARRDVGNLSWAGIALTRMYHRTRRYRYLHAAETIGHWIRAHCTVDDAWGGFSGGEDAWGNAYRWRSVEHNVDAFSFFANLHHLTGETAWKAASESARRLVLACRVEEGDDVVYYVTGTGNTMELNRGVVPTDTQSWTALAGIDPGPAEEHSLRYMTRHMDATSAGFAGTRFARDGREVQNEATAGAAMALQLSTAGLTDAAERYYDSLLRQIEEAPNADGYGVVATPAPEADTGPGLGWKYFNFLHVASSAWTGLALLAREDHGANPYAPLSRVGCGG